MALTNSAPDRDAQPEGGVNAALGTSFNYRGYGSHLEVLGRDSRHFHFTLRTL